MANWLKMLKRIRIRYRRSSTLTKTVVMSTIALSMAALLILHFTTNATRAATEDLADQAAQLEQENEKLEENIDALGSADSVEQIAKDELGMVDPDTVVIQPQD